MNWADLMILAIILLSGLLSIQRGFMREALSLVTWVAAFIIARLFTPSLSLMLTEYIATPSLRIASAFILLFIATLLVGALLSRVMVMLVTATGLTATDRILGMGFGLARGAVVVVVLVALLGGTPAVQDQWWQQSQLIPHFVLMEGWTRQMAGEVAQAIWAAGR